MDGLLWVVGGGGGNYAPKALNPFGNHGVPNEALKLADCQNNANLIAVAIQAAKIAGKATQCTKKVFWSGQQGLEKAALNIAASWEQWKTLQGEI
jgi:hypothetical protein